MTARQTSTQISSVDVQCFLSDCLSTPQVRAWKLRSVWCQKRDANGKATSLPAPRSSDAVGFLLLSLTAACSVAVVFFFFCTDGLHRLFPARCNDIQIGGVICQVHFALGLTPGRSAHCVSRGKKALHVACIYRAISSRLRAWRIELGALSSLQMWQISTVAPFDTKCGTIIELVQP